MNAFAAQGMQLVLPSDRELVLTRVFDAPVGLVWQCWTRKEHIEKWLAPHGLTIPMAGLDLRAGGKWYVCIRWPEGREVWAGGTYREIVPNKLLVMTDIWDARSATPGPETVVTVRFIDQGDRTKITLHQAEFETAEQRDRDARGWSSSFDMLAERLAATQA